MAFALFNIEELNNSGLSGQLNIETDTPQAQEWSYGKYSYLTNYEKYLEFHKSILHEPILVEKLIFRSLNYNSVDIDIQVIKKDSFGQKQINVIDVDVIEQSKIIHFGEVNIPISFSNKESITIPLQETANLSVTMEFEQLNRASEFDFKPKQEKRNIVLNKKQRKKTNFWTWIKEKLQ